jgi:deoxyribodipyrimidine photolyase-related protein
LRPCARLAELGHRVIYLKLDDAKNKQTIAANLSELIRKKKFTRFEYLLPDEYRLDIQLRDFCKTLGIDHQAADSEHFLTERHELKEFFTGKKRFLMEWRAVELRSKKSPGV